MYFAIFVDFVLIVREGTYRGDQPIEIDGLLEVPRGLETFGALRTVVRRGHADHRDIRDIGLLQLMAPELVAAHHRHHQVEQDDVRAPMSQRVEGFPAIGRRLHVEALGLEEHREHLAQVCVIFNDENGLH